MKALRALVLYSALTVVLTYPLAFRLHIMDPGDSAYFAWAMGWTIHALETDPAMLPHGNIFHPLRFALGGDEPVLGTTLLALPLSVFTNDAVWLFNVTRLLTYALTGVTTYLLALELGCGEGPALFAGAAFAFSPIRTDQVAHLSTLGTQWLPLVILFMHRFARLGRYRDALLAALFLVLAGLACGYHEMIGVLVLPLAALPLFWGRWNLMPAAAVAVAVAGLGSIPLYALHHAALSPAGFIRGREETVFYSAPLESFLATSSWNWLYGSLTEPFRGVGPGNLFPGLVLPGLATAGAIGLWRRRERPDREVVALLILAFAAALVALGPEVRVAGRSLFYGPFALVREAIPIFRMIRVTSRAGIFIALALAVLAARVLTTWRGRPRLVLGVTALALAETLVVPIPLSAWAQVIDTRRPPPAVYPWLAAQPGEFAILELPIVDNDGYFRQPAYDESIYMAYSTLHWKRLANGYAGLEPAHYRQLRELCRRFPSEECLAVIRALQIRYVVLHRGGYGPNKWARIERGLPAFTASLHEVVRFGGDTVFEVRSP